jgi:hypothetical protein
MLLTAYIIGNESGIGGGDTTFKSPKDTYDSIVGSLKDNVKYGAFKLDIENGFLYYNTKDTKNTFHIDQCSFIVYCIDANIADNFDIDVMNIDPDNNTIIYTADKSVCAEKMLYTDFIKLVKDST